MSPFISRRRGRISPLSITAILRIVFGINGSEFFVIFLLVVVLVGPQRLPEYAQKLGQLVRQARVALDNAKSTIAEEIGPELADMNLKDLDPRQYDPRKIVRDALGEDLDAIKRDLQDPFKSVADAVKESAPSKNDLSLSSTAKAGAAAGGAATAAATATASDSDSSNDSSTIDSTAAASSDDAASPSVDSFDSSTSESVDADAPEAVSVDASEDAQSSDSTDNGDDSAATSNDDAAESADISSEESSDAPADVTDADESSVESSAPETSENEDSGSGSEVVADDSENATEAQDEDAKEVVNPRVAAAGAAVAAAAAARDAALAADEASKVAEEAASLADAAAIKAGVDDAERESTTVPSTLSPTASDVTIVPLNPRDVIRTSKKAARTQASKRSVTL